MRKLVHLTLLAALALAPRVAYSQPSTIPNLATDASPADSDMIELRKSGETRDKKTTRGVLRGGLALSSRTISTTSPLTGGGDLSANRTFTLGTPSANTFLAGPTSGGPAAAAYRVLNINDFAAALITYAKIQDVSGSNKLLGRISGAGPMEEIGVGSGLAITAGNLVASGGSSGYDPNTHPSTCWGCEEFTGGTENLTWRSGNLGGNNARSLYLDHSFFEMNPDPGSRQNRVYWTDLPGSGDFQVTMRFSMQAGGTYNYMQVGLIFLDTGSEATPTLMRAMTTQSDGAILSGTIADYTSDIGCSGCNNAYTYVQGIQGGASQCVQARFTASTKKMRFYFATDCINWREPWQNGNSLMSEQTFTNQPPSVGYYVSSPTNGTLIQGPQILVDWVRIFNDGTHDAAPFPPGQ